MYSGTFDIINSKRAFEVKLSKLKLCCKCKQSFLFTTVSYSHGLHRNVVTSLS